MNAAPPLRGPCAAALAAVFAACSTTPKQEFDAHQESLLGEAEFQAVKLNNGVKPHHLQPPAEGGNMRVGPGDVLTVEMADVGGSSAACLVTPDGMIYYDLAGGVHVAGKTLSEIKKLLETELARHDYAFPVVSVNLGQVASQGVTLLGEVGAPGSYGVAEPQRLLDIIAQAGGIAEETADLERSIVVRDNQSIAIDLKGLVMEGDMSQNLYLHPGDYVFIPIEGTQQVHVLGEVNSPGPVAHSPSLNLLAAIAAARGPTPAAWLGHVTIVRGSSTNPRVATVNLNDVMVGDSPNFFLRPNDIVWVPNSPWRKVEEYAEVAVRSAATSGARRGAQELFFPDRQRF
jgi:protein involved in polysaccharide export with SLBB domain